MQLLIYDSYFTPSPDFEAIACSRELLPCNSCFGCWVKTHGVCVKRDMYTIIATKLSRCNQLHIISKCCWGSFSQYVQNVLERCVGYLHPQFEVINGETYYHRRYDNSLALTVSFYGTLTKAEERTAKAVANDLAISLHTRRCDVFFFKTEHEANAGYALNPAQDVQEQNL